MVNYQIQENQINNYCFDVPFAHMQGLSKLVWHAMLVSAFQMYYSNIVTGVLLLCSASNNCSEHTNCICSGGGDTHITVSKEDTIQVWYF